MTKEERAKVEKALSGIYGQAKLRVDGYEIALARALIGKNQLGVVVFVNGVWKGEWVGRENECPEQRFMRPSDRYVYTAKSRAGQKKLIKQFGKRRCKELGIEDPDKKYRVFLPYFSTGKAVLRHFQKTFTSIELQEVIGA